VQAAAEVQGEAWVLTFDPHPMKVLRPDSAPSLLADGDQKINLIRSLNPHGVLELPFTPELAAREPEEFIRNLTAGIPNLVRFVVGPDWRFGRGGGGDVDQDLLRARYGVVPLLDDEILGWSVSLADQRAHYAISNSDAAPWPPPMHIVQTTYLAPRRLPSISAWPTRRAPDIP